jgi:Tfp pilus assembly protein PilX
MRSQTSEYGIALPMAMLLIAVLTVLLAAGFSALGSERRVNANDEAQLDAFMLAETGLERFIARRDSLGFTSAPPAVAESTRITLGGGYADVVLQRVRTDSVAKRYGYAVRSHGVSTVAALRGTPQAERTVAQYATWETGTMNVLSSWTSLSGLLKNGASSMGTGGVDACAVMPTIAGVAVPTNPGYTQNGGSSPAPQGNPPVKNLGNNPEAAESVKIDWDGIVNRNAVTPDITIPPGSWPSFTDPDYWPVIRVNGSYALPGDGQGTLIVTGSLTISGNLTWRGVLLVGDNLISNGINGVDGATITGLNVKLGASVPQSDVGNGTKRYNYNSCNVDKAMARFGQLVGYTNAWVDNWPTY